SSSGVEGDECGCPDGDRRSDALPAGSSFTRVCGISCASSLPKRLVGPDLPDHCGFDCGLHSLRLAVALRVADESGYLRLRESSGRCVPGIFLRWRIDRCAYASGHTTGPGERDHDYYDEEGCGEHPCARVRVGGGIEGCKGRLAIYPGKSWGRVRDPARPSESSAALSGDRLMRNVELRSTWAG